MGQFFDPDEIIFDPLIIQDIGKILTVGKTNRGSVVEMEDRICFVVVIETSPFRWQFPLIWNDCIFTDFRAGAAKHKSTDSRS